MAAVEPDGVNSGDADVADPFGLTLPLTGRIVTSTILRSVTMSVSDLLSYPLSSLILRTMLFVCITEKPFSGECRLGCIRIY
jgi:hypothetical protein